MKRKCHYYCAGYCFWNGDTGEVCDTDNNRHDGYCPMQESDKELEEHAKAILEEMEKNKNGEN